MPYYLLMVTVTMFKLVFLVNLINYMIHVLYL